MENDHIEIPGLGFLSINAFVLRAREPVVIDTGLGLPDRDFLAGLGSIVDPADVRWIWLTHPDRDHTGFLVRATCPRVWTSGSTHQVALATDTVARMNLEEAVDAWTSWTSRQR